MKVPGFLNGPGRRRRSLLLLLALPLLVTIVPPAPPREERLPASAWLTIEPVVLDSSIESRDRVGRLRFRRGFVLRSPDRRFGGLSAMHVADGRVVALSDVGMRFDFPVPAVAGRLPLAIAPLPIDGRPSRGRLDTEAMAVAGRDAWVAFERLHEIARYRLPDWRPIGRARPPAMRRWRLNRGPEAMVRLSDGRWLVFSEGRRGETLLPVLLLASDPARPGTPAQTLAYRRPAGFHVTDASLLPGGRRLLLLHRRVRGLGRFEALLSLIDLSGLEGGAPLQGRPLALLRSPLTVDNMEALAVAREYGKTIVRIASDDNFTGVQRTLWLEFALD